MYRQCKLKVKKNRNLASSFATEHHAFFLNSENDKLYKMTEFKRIAVYKTVIRLLHSSWSKL